MISFKKILVVMFAVMAVMLLTIPVQVLGDTCTGVATKATIEYSEPYLDNGTCYVDLKSKDITFESGSRNISFSSKTKIRTKNGVSIEHLPVYDEIYRLDIDIDSYQNIYDDYVDITNLNVTVNIPGYTVTLSDTLPVTIGKSCLYVFTIRNVKGNVIDYVIDENNTVRNYLLPDEKAVPPELPDDYNGKYVSGWYKDSEYAEEFDFDTYITEPITLYAKWEDISDEISNFKDGETYNVYYGDEITLTATSGAKATHDWTVTVNGETIRTGEGKTFTLDAKEIPANTQATVKYVYTRTAHPESPTTYTFYINVIYKQGDIDGNGTVEKADAQILLAHINGTETLADDVLKRSDMNYDGEIDINDVKLISDVYEVKFNIGEVGEEIDSQYILKDGTASKPDDPTAKGYTFVGWFTDSTYGTEFNFDNPITADTVIYAKWTTAKYTVSFNGNGRALYIGTQNVEYGNLATDPGDPGEEGFIFGGWYTDQACSTTPFDFSTPITGDTELFAKWTPIVNTVSFNGNGHTITTESQSVEYGKTATEPAAPKVEGYTFDGWFTDQTCNGSFDFDAPITADTEIFARWIKDIYDVSFNGNGRALYIGTQNVEYGNLATDPGDPEEEGFIFGGWYTDRACSTTPFDFSTPITGDTELFAKWTPKGYLVTFDMGGHGNAVEMQSIESGKTAAQPADPTETGYIFGGWYTDKACTVKFDFNTPITANTELFAKWTTITYTVTFNANGQAVTIEPQKVEYNKTATEPTVPALAGVALVDWYTDSALTKAFDFSTPITADTTLYARWTEFYNVGDADGNGKVTAFYIREPLKICFLIFRGSLFAYYLR